MSAKSTFCTTYYILAAPLNSDVTRLAQCRATIDSQLSAKLADARSMIAAGKNDDAKKLVDDIDAQYGGLAAPQTVDLAKELGSR